MMLEHYSLYLQSQYVKGKNEKGEEINVGLGT